MNGWMHSDRATSCTSTPRCWLICTALSLNSNPYRLIFCGPGVPIFTLSVRSECQLNRCKLPCQLDGSDRPAGTHARTRHVRKMVSATQGHKASHQFWIGTADSTTCTPSICTMTGNERSAALPQETSTACSRPLASKHATCLPTNLKTPPVFKTSWFSTATSIEAEVHAYRGTRLKAGHGLTLMQSFVPSSRTLRTTLRGIGRSDSMWPVDAGTNPPSHIAAAHSLWVCRDSVR